MRTTAPFPFSYSLVLRLRGPETVSVDCKRSPCEQPNCNTQKIIHTTRSNSIAVCVSCVCRLRITRCFKNNPHRVKNSLKKTAHRRQRQFSAVRPPSRFEIFLAIVRKKSGHDITTRGDLSPYQSNKISAESVVHMWRVCAPIIDSEPPSNQPTFQEPSETRNKREVHT
jgi:hypothetical protein